MEEHKLYLEKVCRLCGSFIKTDKSYSHPKLVVEFKEEVFIVYGINCDDEDENTYPKKLCSSCKRNLTRLVQTSKSKEAPQYSPHQENDCVCKSKRKSSSGSAILHKKHADNVFMQYGFIKLNAGTERSYFKAKKTNKQVIVELTLTLNDDQSWVLSLYDHIIDPNKCDVLRKLPLHLSDENIFKFLNSIENSVICPGISDFCDIINRRVDFKTPFPDRTGGISAYVETVEECVVLRKEKFGIVRPVECLRLFTGTTDEICSSCSDYRKKLMIYRERQEKSEERKQAWVTDSSSVNIKHLSIEELRERLSNANKIKRDALKKVGRLSLTVKDLIEKKGVTIEEEQHELLTDIINKNVSPFKDDTPQWLLWQQQEEEAGKKDSRGMRWHPLIIRWCLSIYHTSPAAYKQMTNKKNKFIVLPHINTLKKYTNFTSPSSGFNPDIIERLVVDSKVGDMPEFKRNVSIAFDEMKIKSDLVYSRANGKLVGFTEMGDVNEELRSFEDQCLGKPDQDRDFARYVNVYMVRGIFSNLAYPFGYFASTGFTADTLYPCTLQATKVLESLGFKVRCWICDGASPNRKFFRLCEADDPGDSFYYTWNPFDPQRKIFFISDVPHLLKTTRNNIENSHGNRNTRNLHFQRHDVSWNHIVNVYEWDLGLHAAAPGLRRLHKLTEEHVHLSGRLRMRVKLAAQVLSNSVAAALEAQGIFYTNSTIKIIKLFDRTFDCLNGISSVNYGKPDRAPYRKVDDPRYDFLLQTLDILKQWRDEANATQGMKKEEKNRLCLSIQTDRGWNITIKSFVELTRLLLQEEGAVFILSEKFSQDPLEEHFARQRRRGGANENPNLMEFQRQELVLNVMSSNLISDLRGNTRGRQAPQQQLDIHDMRKLPTKRKHSE